MSPRGRRLCDSLSKHFSHCSPHSSSLEDVLGDGGWKDPEGNFPLRTLFEVDFLVREGRGSEGVGTEGNSMIQMALR